MKCGYCGKLLKDDAQFCSNCGRNLQEIDDEPSVSTTTAKGAYTLSIITLLFVMATVAFGGYAIIHRDLHPEKTVYSSDNASSGLHYDIASTDAALVGKWLCTDRAAADYGDKNFGVEVRVLLRLDDDGSFTLDYSMTDTGVAAKSISTSGNYSTEDGIITFTPEDNPGTADYIKRHGKRPSFPYTTDEGSFTLTYENGKHIVFRQSKD